MKADILIIFLSDMPALTKNNDENAKMNCGFHEFTVSIFLKLISHIA